MLGLGLGLTRPRAPAKRLYLTTNVLAGNRNQIATSNMTVAVPYTSRVVRYARSDGDISNLRTVDCRWGYVQGDAIETNLTTVGAGFTFKRFIEYPIGGSTFYPVLWSGSASCTITSTSPSGVFSDPVAGLTIKAGDPYAVRTVITAISGNAPVIELPTTANAMTGCQDGSAAGDFGNTGTVPVTAQSKFYAPNIITADVFSTNPNPRSAIIFGDSLTWGQEDKQTVGATLDHGYLGRLFANDLPYFKCASPGLQGKTLASTTVLLSALLAGLKFTLNIQAVGTNDLRLAETDTSIMATRSTLAALVPGTKRVDVTLFPRSSSTDSFATTANQAPKTDGNWGLLTALNAAIRAMPTVLEASDLGSTTRDSGIWKVAPTSTPDGTHPNSVRCQLIADALKPQVATL